MQKHSFYLAKFLVMQGIEVTLLHCVDKKELPTHEEVIKAMGLPENSSLRTEVFRFPDFGSMPGHYLRESYAYSLAIFKKLDWREFDLVYAKGFSAWALLDKKRRGMELPPIAVKFHGYEMFQPPASFKSRLQHYLLKGPVKFNNIHADYVFSYGGKISSIIASIGVAKQKIIELPTGIEASWCRTQISATQEGPRRFLFIGRYERRKGIEELNQVLSELPAEAEFAIDMVGPIPQSKRLKDPRINYHGKVMETDKLQAIMDACQVLITPSKSEGMPNVIMEGMARGLAVIATDVGAVSMLVDADNGWLIQVNHKGELRRAIDEAIACQLPELNEKQRCSLERVKRKFTWEHVSQETRKSFEQIV